MKILIGVLSILAECYLGDVTRTSIRRHSCYGNIDDVIGIQAWQTVYAMLRQIFNGITNLHPFNRNLRFSQTNNFSQVIFLNSLFHVIYGHCI